MELRQIVLFASLFGIFILIVIAQNISNINEAEIKNIYFSNDVTTIITLDNQTLILFNAEKTELKEGDKIAFEGSPDFYKGKSQIIISKIWKIG